MTLDGLSGSSTRKGRADLGLGPWVMRKLLITIVFHGVLWTAGEL